MKSLQSISILCLGLLLCTCQKPLKEEEKTGTLTITFTNVVKGNSIGLGSTVHTNAFGEQYTLSKLKYYVSNVSAYFAGITNTAEKDSYHLIDESKPASLTFSFAAKVNKYNTLQFLLGVDSIRNVSGAQTGALDPLNDMFWTWNSGYIMAKMEGTSPQSNQVNKNIEYHIGGFSGANSALKYISFNLNTAALIDVREGKTTAIVIEADFDKWWQNPNDLKIADNPVCVSQGVLAKKYADNYADIFSIKSITNN